MWGRRWVSMCLCIVSTWSRYYSKLSSKNMYSRYSMKLYGYVFAMNGAVVISFSTIHNRSSARNNMIRLLLAMGYSVYRIGYSNGFHSSLTFIEMWRNRPLINEAPPRMNIEHSYVIRIKSVALSEEIFQEKWICLIEFSFLSDKHISISECMNVCISVFDSRQ